MMTKKEFISQLTLCASRYADERLGDNNKLFASNQHLREDMLEWEQKYHSAMAANKKLDEQNEGLQVEKQALLDVLSEWKSKVQSLNALNATLSEELQELKKELANAEDARDIHYRAKLDQGKTIANMATEVVKLKKDDQLWLITVQNWERNYRSVTDELDQVLKELAAAKEQHEDFKKKSHGILATMGENLQKKQEQIEALTCWKEFAENTIHELSEKLKDAKDVIQTQENTIEWLDGKVKRLKEKKAKKEQND